MQGDKVYPSVSVVIPARNEAKNLMHVLPQLPDIVTQVVLVDGNSTDDTIEVAKRIRPDIHILKQSGHGKGNAMILGFEACTGDIIVTLDADGSANPAEIFRFVDALNEGYDLAKGSRFLKGAGSEDITLLRKMGNFALCQAVNVLFLQRFSDFCYGYNAFWRYCLDEVSMDCTGFEIEAQLYLRTHKAGLKIVEVPSVEHLRLHGTSNLNTFRDGWRVLKLILSERITGHKPSQRQITPSYRAQEQNTNVEYQESVQTSR